MRGTAQECFGVPSRFGVGTLLVVTAAYGALLAVLRVVGYNRPAIVWLVVFVSLVGTGQMLLFGSRRPREASLLTGAAGLPIVALLVVTIHNGGFRLNELTCLLCSAVIVGAPAGYLAGGLVAGVFLIMDSVQRLLTRLFAAREHPDVTTRTTDHPRRPRVEPP